MRLSAPMPLEKNAHVSGPCEWATLSFYGKGSRSGVQVGVSVKHKEAVFTLTERWQRYSVTTNSPRPGGDWGEGVVTTSFHGPVEGVCWIAGVQLEATRPAERQGAEHWQQDFDLHYDCDAGTAHGGRFSLRAVGRSGNDRPLAGGRQVVQLDKPTEEPIVVGAWCRSEGVPRGGNGGEEAQAAVPAVRIEAYGPYRKPDVEAIRERLGRLPRRIPRAIAGEEAKLNPVLARATLSFADAGREWTYREITVTARGPVQRVFVTPCYDGRRGTAWFDDLAVRQDGANRLANAGFETPETQWVPSREAKLTPFETRLPRNSDNWPDPPEASCPAVDEPPTIDGKLDDPAWQEATTIGRFLEFQGAEQENSQLSARVCRDAHTLYVAFRWDGDGGGKSNHGRDLPVTLKGPAVGVCLKPELLHPDRSFLDFMLGKDGSKIEGKGFSHRFGPAEKFFSGGFDNQGWGFYSDEVTDTITPTMDRPWNRPWQGKVAVDGEAWTAEMAVPVSSMDLGVDRDFWGINFYGRTADNVTYAWSPARAELREGWFIQHPKREKGTRYFFGRLTGIKGMSAEEPYEHMLRMVDAGLECGADDSVGVVLKVARNVPVGREQLDVDVEVRLIKPEPDDLAATYQIAGLRGEGQLKRVRATLTGPATVIRVPGFSRRWSDEGLYQILATVKLRDTDLVLGEMMRRVVLEDRYNSLLARVRIRTELTYYMAEKQARVLVMSQLPDDATVRFEASQDGKRYPVKVIGDGAIAAGGKRYVPMDLTKLPLGDLRLAAAFLSDDGRVVAKAYDRLTRREPVGWGVQVNRVTGCFRVDGKWTILRSRSRKWASHAQAAANDDRAWIAGAMSAHAMPPEKIDRAIEKIRAEQENPRIACWYLIDEPQGDTQSCLDLYRRARQADPYHAMNLGWGGASILAGRGGNGTYRAIDVMSGAFYPFGLARSWSAPWNHTLQYGAMLYQIWGRDAAEHGIPITSWMSVIRGGNREGRPPTPDEMRCQQYLALIYGHRMIKYWTGQTPGTYYEPLFRQIVQDHREMDVFADFLGGRDVIPLFTGDREYVHYAVWRNGDELFLIVCNPTPFELESLLGVPSMPRSPSTLRRVGGRANSVQWTDGRVTARLKPWDAAMFHAK